MQSFQQRTCTESTNGGIRTWGFPTWRRSDGIYHNCHVSDHSLAWVRASRSCRSNPTFARMHAALVKRSDSKPDSQQALPYCNIKYCNSPRENRCCKEVWLEAKTAARPAGTRPERVRHARARSTN